MYLLVFRVNWEEYVATLNAAAERAAVANATVAPFADAAINETIYPDLQLLGEENNTISTTAIPFANITTTTTATAITTESTLESIAGLLGYGEDRIISEEQQRNRYILTYAILIVVSTYIFIHRTFAFFTMCVRASINIHDMIFRGISRATMFFYNTNTSGRILNRFSRDIGNIDTLLPPVMMDSLAAFIEFIGIVCIVVFVNFWLILPTLAMAVLFYVIRRGYMNTARNLQRLDAISECDLLTTQYNTRILLVIR